MSRVFYVDAAHSITSRTRKRYWKCSVVEKNLINFANSKATWAVEAYTILALIFWLVEQKENETIKIFTDCLALVKPNFMKSLLGTWEKKKRRGKKRQTELINHSKASYFIQLAHEISQKNGIELEEKATLLTIIVAGTKENTNPPYAPKKTKPLEGLIFARG